MALKFIIFIQNINGWYFSSKNKRLQESETCSDKQCLAFHVMLCKYCGKLKNYLIIGGSSGVGQATGKILAQNGNSVFATYFTNKSLSDVSQLSYHYLNITEPDFSFIPETLDGLVYCPGSILLKPFARIKPEAFVNDYELQVLGAVKTIQAALPALKNSEQASVVLFSTVAVQTGFNYHSLVSASKGALEGLTRALAAEFAPKIRFNCIAPSITDTPLAASLLNSEEKKTAHAQRHPLKRIGTAEDMAQLAVFLLSENSSFITGQILKADGGISSLKI